MGQKTVLIIEDNAFIVQFVKKILKHTGLEMHGVSHAYQGYEAVVEREPDLIILDRGLPDGDGNELLVKLKANPKTSHIPIMMLTSENRSPHIKTSLDLGADDYIVKPFQADQLLTRVRRLLKEKLAREKAMMRAMQEAQA